MSYSFTVRAATKTEAKEKLAAELDTVVVAQPVHAADREQALAAASAFVDMLADDETRDVAVSVNGSLAWNTASSDTFTGASVGVSAYLSSKESA